METDFGEFVVSKPKKYKNAELMVCKIKSKNGDPFTVQFPKMKIVEHLTKKIELEFTNQTGYNKKVYNFLSIQKARMNERSKLFFL